MSAIGRFQSRSARVNPCPFLLLALFAVNGPSLHAAPKPAFVIQLAEGEDQYQLSGNLSFRDNGNLFVGKQVKGSSGKPVYRVVEYDGETGAKLRSKELVEISSSDRKRASIAVAGTMLHYTEMGAGVTRSRETGTALQKVFSASSLEELSSRQGIPYAKENPFFHGFGTDGSIFFGVDTDGENKERVIRVFALDPNNLNELILDKTEVMPADPLREFYIGDNGDIWWTTGSEGRIARYDHDTKQFVAPSIPVERGTDFDNIVFLASGYVTLTDETQTKGKHNGRAYRFARDDGRELARHEFSGCAFLDGSYVAVSSDEQVIAPQCVEYDVGYKKRLGTLAEGLLTLDEVDPDRKMPKTVTLAALDAETLEPLLKVRKNLKKDPRKDYVVWHGNGETRLAYVGADDFNRIEVYRVRDQK